MSPRYIPAHAQPPLHHKAGRLVRKHSRAVAATAIATAGIGAIGASAGAGPWTAATAASRPPTAAMLLDSHEVPPPGFVGALTWDAAHAAAGIAHGAGAAHAAPAPAHPSPARQARAVPAKPAPAKPAPRPRLSSPFEIYDSVMPSAIPNGHQVATYSNGGYAASASEVADRGHVLWIDTNGSNTHADALDVEPGDASPAGAAYWVKAKLSASPRSVAIVYTMISQWQAVRDNIEALPQSMQSHVRYWIADPTGYPHILPGSNATQWYWGKSYDITSAYPGFES